MRRRPRFSGTACARAPWLARAPRGDGHLVIDIPGWLAPESSCVALRAYLRWLGYDARPWGFGVNRGDPERDAKRLASRIVKWSDDRPGRVSLVGWSLGGVIAREVARALPQEVRRVVTYGTPVVGGPTHTVGAETWSADERARITAVIERVDASNPIRSPIAAIFSKRDGIVDWRACIDRSSIDVGHVEVTSPHLGLGIDPDVWTVTADRLAIAPAAARSRRPDQL